MSMLLKLASLTLAVLLALCLFSVRMLWRLSVYLFHCIEDGIEDGNDSQPVIFSYSDDHTGDPNNTTVTDKSYTPGQSIPLYKRH